MKSVGSANDVHLFAGQPDKIKARYASLWIENGGELGSDGFCYLASREMTHEESAVESKHRAAFRKRESLRQQSCALVIDVFATRNFLLQAA